MRKIILDLAVSLDGFIEGPNQEVDAMKKVVFSTSEDDFEGNPEVISSNIRKRVLELKSYAGKNIWLFGGSGLITSLVNLGFVDEILIGINPVILGDGIPLFKEIQQRLSLHLTKAKQYRSGLVGLYYDVHNQI